MIRYGNRLAEKRKDIRTDQEREIDRVKEKRNGGGGDQKSDEMVRDGKREGRLTGFGVCEIEMQTGYVLIKKGQWYWVLGLPRWPGFG